MENKKELQEGDNYPEEGCNGVLIYNESENCSCHLHPPCESCISVKLYCTTCLIEVED